LNPEEKDTRYRVIRFGPYLAFCALRRFFTGEYEEENLAPIYAHFLFLALALHKSIWPSRTVDGQYLALANFDFGAAKTSTSLKTLKHLLPSSRYREYCAIEGLNNSLEMFDF
jgi:hypothetical protein